MNWSAPQKWGTEIRFELENVAASHQDESQRNNPTSGGINSFTPMARTNFDTNNRLNSSAWCRSPQSNPEQSRRLCAMLRALVSEMTGRLAGRERHTGRVQPGGRAHEGRA